MTVIKNLNIIIKLIKKICLMIFYNSKISDEKSEMDKADIENANERSVKSMDITVKITEYNIAADNNENSKIINILIMNYLS